MPSNPRKQVSRKNKNRVVDVEPVEVLNRRGNVVYRPKQIVVVKEATFEHGPSHTTGSGVKRRRAPSDTMPEMCQEPDPEENANTTKKKKIGGRTTMVRDFPYL